MANAMMVKVPNDVLNAYKKRRNDQIVNDWYEMHGGCFVCGEQDRVVLVAHHIDPNTKKRSIGRFSSAGTSRGALQEELDKCIPLCCNCHARVHAGVVNIPSSEEWREAMIE